MSGNWIAPPDWGSNILQSSEMDTYITDNENYLKTHIWLEAAGALTISGGAITITQGYHKVAGEGAATDDLDTIGGGLEGMVIILRPNGNVITLKNGVGADKLVIGSDIVLLSDDDHVALIFDGTNWNLLSGGAFYIQQRIYCDFAYPAPGVEWSPSISGAYLDASQTAAVTGIRLSGLVVGDQIVSYKLKGDATETTGLTLDCRLVRSTLGHPIVILDPVPGGDIVQITGTGSFDAQAVLTNPEIVIEDCVYSLIIEGTTGVGDEITVMGACVVVRRRMD